MLDYKCAGAGGAYVLVKNWKNAALNKAIDELIQEADASRALTLEQCYNAAMAMQKGQGPGYGLKWRARAIMANKLWKDKKMREKWEKFLMNMPAHLYERLFPDMYHWVKKFTITTMKKKNSPVKMGQVCQRMQFRGAPQDFSMWACLFGDLAFTKVTVEELQALVPYMKMEIQKFRQKYKWWPHPAVLMNIARTKRKQQLAEVKKQTQEEAQGTKRKASKRNGDEGSGYKHVWWHDQSQCWRALVKKTSMVRGKPGSREYKHFETVKEAVKEVSDRLGVPADKLKLPEGGGKKRKMASLYEGVFYDTRKAYANKWMAVIYVKKCGSKKKVQKSLGHFREQIVAAKAVAKAQKKEVRDIRKSKKLIYNSRSGRDLAEQRFMILSDVFLNNTIGKKRVPANPPDYEKSEMLMKNPAHQKMFGEEPVMEEVSIGLKYGPPRDDLLQAWKKSRGSAKSWGALATKLGLPKNKKIFRKLRIIMTLQKVARMLHKKDCSLWVQNAGRYVSKQQGPVMFLRRMGLIQKAGKMKVQKVGKMKVGK